MPVRGMKHGPIDRSSRSTSPRCHGFQAGDLNCPGPLIDRITALYPPGVKTDKKPRMLQKRDVKKERLW